MNRLEELIGKMGTPRILILGDFLVDEFIFGEISRVSREAPVLILKYQETDSRPGGAANTVANVAALGPEVISVGILGDDEPGNRLLSLWPSNVRSDFVIRERRHRTTRKTRILAGSFHSYRQQVVRLDHEHSLFLDEELEQKLIDSLREVASECDAFVISDYSLGAITPGIRNEMTRLAHKHAIPLVVDSRDQPGDFPGATSVTPNITEVEKAHEIHIGTNQETLEEVGFETLLDWEVEALVVTRGKLGMSLFLPGEVLHLPCYGGTDAVDVTGAGDTVAATYTAALAAGADFKEAAILANYAGGLVVMKKGTATTSRQELRQAAREGLGGAIGGLSYPR